MQPIRFFGVLFLFTLFWMFYLFSPFLMNMLIALLLCVATLPLKEFLDKKIRSPWLTSLISVFLLLLLLFLPLLYVGGALANLLLNLNIESIKGTIEMAKEKILLLLSSMPWIEERAMALFGQMDTAGLIKNLLNKGMVLGRAGFDFVINTLFISLFLYFFLYYGRPLYDYFLRFIPFTRAQSEELFGEVGRVLGVVFYSSLASILIQGIVFGLLASFLGYDFLLCVVLYGLASLIPVVGGALIWIPLASYEFYLGNESRAILIALYSLLFIGIVIDNLLRPLLIAFINKKILGTPVEMSELLIFLSMLAGITSFGFWGIILGPVVMAFFIALLRFYEKAFLKL